MPIDEDRTSFGFILCFIESYTVVSVFLLIHPYTLHVCMCVCVYIDIHTHVPYI